MTSVAQETSGQAQFCGTTQVARILGLSVGTVQSLVERQELLAWKTRGGHRRISLASVQEYQRRHHGSALGQVNPWRIMWVQEEGEMRQKLAHNLSRWGLAFQVEWVDHMVEASMVLQTWRPTLVVVDLKTAQVDALQFIRHVQGQAEFRPLTVLVFCNQRRPDEVQAHGSGAQVVWVKKPMDQSWLKGYLEAFQTLQQRQALH